MKTDKDDKKKKGIFFEFSIIFFSKKMKLYFVKAARLNFMAAPRQKSGFYPIY